MGYCTGNLCVHKGGASMSHIKCGNLLRGALMRSSRSQRIQKFTMRHVSMAIPPTAALSSLSSSVSTPSSSHLCLHLTARHFVQDRNASGPPFLHKPRPNKCIEIASMKNSPIANDLILQKQTFDEGAMSSWFPVQRHYRHCLMSTKKVMALMHSLRVQPTTHTTNWRSFSSRDPPEQGGASDSRMLAENKQQLNNELASMPALHGTSNSMSEALGTSGGLALTSNGLAKTKKFVVVVESPAKAKTIEKYLGADFTVLPTYGHVRDLAARAGSVRSDDDYAIVWEVPEAAQTHVTKTKNAFKGELCFKSPLHEALKAVGHENWKGSHVASSVFFCLLQRCINESNVAAGRELHHLITKNGFQSDDFLGSHLIRMFTIFDSLPEANQIFGLLSKATVFPWSAIMSAHAKLGQNSLALQFYNQMQLSGVEPDEHIFVTAVKACSDITALTQGMQVHAHIIEKGFECNIFVGNILLSMYMSCGRPADGCIVFNRLPKQDIVSWNAIIAGYVHCKEAEEAIEIFWRMQQEGGMAPEEVTFMCVLQACSMITCLEQGRLIHSCIIESGFVLDTKIDNALIDMYGKCGGLEDAQTVFDKSVSQGIMAWTSLIAGYAEHGYGQQALHIFEKMKKEGIEPDPVTFVCVLKACFHLAFLEQAINIHAHIVLSGLDHQVFIGNALIDMYAKCGSVLDACIAFERVQHPDVVTFNTLITACGQHGCSHEAFQLFEEIYRRGMKPDRVTFLCILRACSVTLALEQGISAYAIESGLHTDVHVSSALIDMCVKCGRLEDAYKTFERLPKRDVVTWNALMGGYAHHGDGKEVIHLFRKMEEEGMKPDKVTFVYILKACSSIAALEHGWQTHSRIIESGFEPDEFVSTTIVDMYINCGSLDSAGIVFDRIPKKTVVTWNTLITGCTQHGQYHLALQKFKDMQEVGLKPDSVTLLCYLSACSHAGLVVHGCGQFKSMRREYDIEPTLEHYNSMVDMLGQAGHLTETEDLLETNPFGPNIVGWTSLLTSCRMQTNVNIGRRCFDHIVRADCLSAAGYVLMSKIYAQAGMWHDVKNVEEMRRYANGWKKPAKAFIEVDKRVHGFSVGDTRHPQSADIYAKLYNLSIQIKEQEEKPQGELATLERSKEDALCGHCEKLAIAFGLLCTPLGTTIRIAKNIRMCTDCHSVTKVISRIETREIIVKDAYRIHHFQDGACSCSE